jgi:hypothetical protein
MGDTGGSFYFYNISNIIFVVCPPAINIFVFVAVAANQPHYL